MAYNDNVIGGRHVSPAMRQCCAIVLSVLCVLTVGLGGRALMRGWKLSLAMMAVLPLIVVSMGILATVMKSSGEVP